MYIHMYLCKHAPCSTNSWLIPVYLFVPWRNGSEVNVSDGQIIGWSVLTRIGADARSCPIVKVNNYLWRSLDRGHPSRTAARTYHLPVHFKVPSTLPLIQRDTDSLS